MSIRPVCLSHATDFHDELDRLGRDGDRTVRCHDVGNADLRGHVPASRVSAPACAEEARAIAAAGRIRLDAILELDESEVDAMVDEFDRWRHKADPSE
jgi:hypothetical protein